MAKVHFSSNSGNTIASNDQRQTQKKVSSTITNFGTKKLLLIKMAAPMPNAVIATHINRRNKTRNFRTITPPYIKFYNKLL